MGKKVWAIVCGAIRQEFELYTTLAMLCDYRANGLIEGIVLSTWKGEIENVEGLRKKLEFLDIYVIELNPLDDKLNQYLDMRYLRQAYQLKAGLDFIPNDVFVLKCRTDYSIDKINCAKDILLGNVDLTIGKFGSLNTGLCYKFAVYRFTATIPFLLVDSGFIAYKTDMYKMLDYEIMSKKYASVTSPDLTFFLSIFWHRFTIFEEFFITFRWDILYNNVNFPERLTLYLQNADETERKNFALPGIFNKFYALYFVLLDTCFYLFNYEKCDRKLTAFQLADVFACDSKIGMKTNLSSCFMNTEALRMIVHGECCPTDGYKKLYEQIKKIGEPYYAEKLCYTLQDFTETEKWLKDKLALDINIFGRWKKIRSPKHNLADFHRAIDILYSDFNIDGEHKDMLHEILYDVSALEGYKFYQSVSSNIEKLGELNRNVYDAALGPALRTNIPRLLKVAAKSLYAGTVKPSLRDSVSFVFERWGGVASQFYVFPLPADKLSACYYYGKYAEPKGKLTVPRTFYHQLIKVFELPPRPNPTSYSDAVLELIKEIVALKYKEYQNDISVRYMIDFLADEFYRDGFTQEEWSYLESYVIKRKYSLPFAEGAPDAFSLLINGAETASSEHEADIIIKLLLREKWDKPENVRKKVDATVTALFEKYPPRAELFVKANRLGVDDVLTLDLNGDIPNDDFVLLLSILSGKKCLSSNKDVIINACKNDPFKRMAAELFLNLENNKKLRFCSLKNGTELWLNYNDFLQNEKNGDFILYRTNDWLLWPQSDRASSSPLAAFIRLKDGSIYLSVEFCSCQCSAKTDLFDKIDKLEMNITDKKSQVMRLKTAEFPFDSADGIKTSVNDALNEFCKTGGILTAAL